MYFFNLLCILLLSLCSQTYTEPILDYPDNMKGEIYSLPSKIMAKKSPHNKDEGQPAGFTKEGAQDWPYDMFSNYLSEVQDAAADPSSPDHNRIKRMAKKGRRGNHRRTKLNASTSAPPDSETVGNSTEEVPIARKGKGKKSKSLRSRANKAQRKKDQDQFQYYQHGEKKEHEFGFVEMPKDLYQAHLRPGVIFRIHMSEAILKMQYRNYGEDKDESVIEADVEYLRLTRKVINDEITKFEDLVWLMGWFANRSELITEHVCDSRYYVVGTPPTLFTHPEEYMKRSCLFNSIFIDHMPYVIGEDDSIMAAVAPPVLHCDASTCTSVPFIDSVMFDEKLKLTNVRTVTRCQASCRMHCRNDPDCLKKCNDRCRAD